MCFHVLEHIPDDRTAVTELTRVVATRGEAWVVVPREDNRPTTFDDPDADPAEHERLYGQSDHVRIYGSDILDRWSDNGVMIWKRPWAACFTAGEHRRAALTGDDDRFWVLCWESSV